MLLPRQLTVHFWLGDTIPGSIMKRFHCVLARQFCFVPSTVICENESNQSSIEDNVNCK